MSKVKSYEIPKKLIWEAYQRVRQNKGSSGVDGVSIERFESNLKANLYKLWNRMSSGSYVPPPVKMVEIPKKAGGTRPLGIPTVADRIAQMVVTLTLTESLDPHFDTDSYGYRPNKSAINAVMKARERCWKKKWAVDIDIKGFFDNLDHELLLKALAKHTNCKWIILYVTRWLKAPVQQPDGTRTLRTKGTPQGGVVSPVLANLFMHYAFDKWMRREHPSVDFERYADDIVVHCNSKEEAYRIKLAIAERLEKCKLSLNETKSKIVFCGVSKHSYSEKSLNFLGFTFRRRKVMSKEGKFFTGFVPAVSKEAKKAIRSKIKSWNIKWRMNDTLKDIAELINPILRGWYNYYGKFYRSELDRVIKRVEICLRGWARNKFRTRCGFQRKIHIRRYLGQVRKYRPYLFEHWRYGIGSPIQIARAV